MDIVIAIGGFLFGVIATLFSDAMASWLARIVPMKFTRWLSAVAANPRLYLRTRRDTPERQINELVIRLFRAWERKDLETYLSCWAEDAVRIVGSNANLEETKSQLREKFLASCQRYAEIKVDSLVLERVALSPCSDSAIVEARYRFSLTRSRDGLPVLEDAREVYAMRLHEGAWRITSNIDHFFVVGEQVAS